MPRKTFPQARQRRRDALREAALLRETQGFFLGVAACLNGLLIPAARLWRRLARTEAYKRVDQTDDAEREPVWDLAATIESLLARDIGDMQDYLRRDARRAGAAAARRMRPRAPVARGAPRGAARRLRDGLS